MSQPIAYNRAYSFTSFQTNNPTTPLPGNQVDVELNAIKATLDQILTNIAVIQNDDTTLKNLSVGVNQMSAAVAAGFNPPKTWVTGTAYTASPSSTVFNSSKIYICLISHTAGVFATDLAAAKWQLILDLTTIPITAASQVSYVPTGGIAATDVQAALTELDTEKAAVSHTHAASAISDSTAAGRSMLTAANVAAQQALLGLGALAYLSSVPFTSADTTFALTGDISPAALAADTNDWAPTSLSSSSVIRVSASSAIKLTGLSGGADGRVLVLHNVGSNTITLTANDTASAAANRFDLSRAHLLQSKQSLALQYDSTSSLWRLLVRQPVTPDIQPLTSGTAATYTTPVGALYLHVRMVGPGAGGGAAITNAGSTPSADTSFGTWTAVKGSGGPSGSGAAIGGAGGTGGTDGTGTKIARVDGQRGGGSKAGAVPAGAGGNSFFGGAGAAIADTGNTAATNSGSGGSGGADGTANAGGGGGSGEFVEFIIPSPATTYTYTVPAGGAGGTVGTKAGGAGAAARIEVVAHFQ
jgi:hypothetical protein